MKKIYILLFIFNILGSNFSFADCITGYACSIQELQNKNKQLEELFLQELNKYYELNINEDFMLGKINDELKYQDFFPFSFILNYPENIEKE